MTDKPDVPEHIKNMLLPDKEPEAFVEKPVLQGSCHEHGEVGFARFVVHDHGEILSEHCAYCLSAILTASIGTLDYPDPQGE